MWDVFLAFASQADSFASGVADALAAWSLTIGPALGLWPGMRLVPEVDQGLGDTRHAVVVVSGDFGTSATARRIWTVWRAAGGSSRSGTGSRRAR